MTSILNPLGIVLNGLRRSDARNELLESGLEGLGVADLPSVSFNLSSVSIKRTEKKRKA